MTKGVMKITELTKEIEETQKRLKELEKSINDMKQKHNNVIDKHIETKFFNKLHEQAQQKEEKEKIKKTESIKENAISNALPIAVITLVVLSGIISLFYMGNGLTGSTIGDVPTQSVKATSENKLFGTVLPFIETIKYVLTATFFALLFVAIIIAITAHRKRK